MRLAPLPVLLLLAACGSAWIAVAPGTAPMECTALRLSARGWQVDHTFTDSTRIRVIKRDGISVDTVTGLILPPPEYSRVNSDWWWGKGPDRHRVGSVLEHEVEVSAAMESCGIKLFATRPRR